jgi:predicted secreted protein
MKIRLRQHLRCGSLILFVSILALTLSSSALSNSSAQEPPPPGEVRLTAEDDGRQVELSEGQALVINLESNPSTGHRWEVEDVAERQEERVLRQLGESEFQPGSNLLGAPGMQIIRFEAVRAGQTTLRLLYRRPWENIDPVRTFSVEVQGVGTFADNPAPLPSTEPSVDGPELTDDRSGLRLPSAYNWCDWGGCTPVQDQGDCGSCWAFATVGPLESNILIHDGMEKDLAEQYLLSCNEDGWNCSGGWFAHDYHLDQIPSGEPDAGAVYETDFPYVASKVDCNSPHPHHEKIISWDPVGNWWSVPPIEDIKQAILDHGPVAASICTNDAFQEYSGGVFTGPQCTDVNHAIVLVGWDDADGAWILRNSWGPDWGENGYMRIGYGVSDVGYAANYIAYSSSGSVGPMLYDSHIVDDDTSDQSSGNGDGIVNCGETIELYATLYNQGTETATYVNAGISTNDSYVTWLGNTSSDYPDIPGRGTGTNSIDFDFEVDPDTPNGHVIHFNVEMTASNGGPWSDSFTVPVACGDQAQWTFLVYLDADNDLEDAGVDDFLEMSSTGSTEDVNIVVQFDRIPGYDSSYGDWTSTKRFLVTPGMTPDPENAIEDIDEANMGDPQTLIDFVAWGISNYPADHYAVVLWDHGSGWRLRTAERPLLKDIAFDDTSGGDGIDMPELRSAMSTITNSGEDPLDLMGFDACLMGMIEVDNQLISYADVRVGSEEAEPWDGWPYDTILSALTGDPTMSADQLGTVVVDEYYASYGDYEVQSAADLQTPYASLNTAVNNFALALMNGLMSHYDEMVTARSNSQEFTYPTYIDLHDFAYEINQYVSDATINAAATEVMNSVNSAIIHERHGSYWPGAHGISIYFPESESSYNSRYDGDQGWLQFTADTQWDEWLHAFYTGATLERRTFLPLVVKEFDASTPNWANIMIEDFEGVFPSGNWSVFDNDGSTNGEYYWDDDDFKPRGGGWSAWPANGGADGLDPQYNDYPNYLDSWMIYGPFNLSDALDAELLFYYWNLSELDYDYLFWGASANGTDFYGTAISGNSGGWQFENFDLTDVHTLGDLTGEPEVWIAFAFQSDLSITDQGPFIDDIILRKVVTGAGGASWFAEESPSSKAPDTLFVNTNASLSIGERLAQWKKAAPD